MAFQPRIRTASEPRPHVPCCTAETALCDTCKAHFGRASLRSAAADFTPPDPYAAGLTAQRERDAKAAAARTYQPQPLRPTATPAGYAPPDPYVAQLERLRREETR